MASSSKDYQYRKTTEAAESIFGPPFAYYKANRSSLDPTLFVVGAIFVTITALDFLLLTNIIIYIRTLDTDETGEIFKHTLVIAVSLLGIFASFKLMVWMIKKFKIKESIKKNKLYQKLSNEVIELEELLGGQREENKAD